MPIINKTISRGGVTNTKQVYVDDVRVNHRAVKQDNKDKLVVTVNGVNYGADTVSINYMSAVIATANFNMLKLISTGKSGSVAYTAIFKTKISWKTADRTISKVSLESIATALELAMNNIGTLVAV